MKKITLQEFSLNTSEYWLDEADWWIQVVGTKTTTPLWEFRRGSEFIFKNNQLPRLCWGEFSAMTQCKRLAFLVQSAVSVLTVYEDDVFLVRLPE